MYLYLKKYTLDAICKWMRRSHPHCLKINIFFLWGVCLVQYDSHFSGTYLPQSRRRTSNLKVDWNCETCEQHIHRGILPCDYIQVFDEAYHFKGAWAQKKIVVVCHAITRAMCCMGKYSTLCRLERK